MNAEEEAIQQTVHQIGKKQPVYQVTYEFLTLPVKEYMQL